jgi:nucleoid-associated protein YgaU
MSSNLSGAANSIKNFLNGVSAAFSGAVSGKLYPTGGLEQLSEVDTSNWNKLPTPYTFSVLSTSGTFRAGGFKDFPLPIAPSKITQSETPAKSIKATQGGTVVTHSGNRYKKLTIEGTTGINPNRGMSGVDASTGRAIAKPAGLEFSSGFEVFLELRNWFRAYNDFQILNPDSAKNYRLVFKNFKDGEFLVVELLDFTMDRQAERPLLYDYKLEFRVLAHFKFDSPFSFWDDLDKQINKITGKIDLAMGIFLGAQETLRKIESAYDSTLLEPLRKVNLAAKALAGTIITAMDMGKRILKNTLTAAKCLEILRTLEEQFKLNKSGQSTLPIALKNSKLPIDIKVAAYTQGAQAIIDLGPGMAAIPAESFSETTQQEFEKEVQAAANLPRSFYEDLVESAKRIKANAEDSFNLGSEAYDELFDRTTTLKSEDIKIVTDLEFQVLGALNDTITAVNALIAYPNLFKSDFQDQVDSITKQFEDEINMQALPAVKQIIVPADTDLEQIALEELGDPTRWVEIAELNGLYAPYIVQNRSEKTANLRVPGDSLLVPQTVQSGFSNNPPAKTIPSTANLNELEKSFATDLKLSESFDLNLSNNGDLAVVSGYENIAQAVILKLGYEKGELRNHPSLGLGLVIGQKFNSINGIATDINQTLRQDSRIEGIKNIAFFRENSALYITFDLYVKQVDIPIPLKVKV